ncbi:MAG: hypothetical protein JJU11_11000 [Candidatus Sumerlaeia bacterium]|nr:hypothetical protein [Candidatus Sumerlaeia bacterium]
MKKYIVAVALLLAAGTTHGQIEISTLADLDNIRNDLSADYILINDIDASPTAGAEYNGGEGWLPIGRQGDTVFTFTGTFDGQGFAITGLTFNRPAGVPGSGFLAGLFGDLDGEAAISNLHLLDVNLEGNSMVGGIAGRIRFQSTATVTNCSVSGIVRGQSRTGGLVGFQEGGSIENCWTEGVVETFGFNRETGGLVGYTNGLIRRSYSTANVSGGDWVGGLVGNGGGDSTLEESFATGDVFGSGALIGGFAGAQKGLVVRCYATGNQSGPETSFGLGGLLGLLDTDGQLEDCFARGDMTGNSAIGGLIGQQRVDSTLTRGYSTGIPDGNTFLVGGLIGQLQSGTVMASYWDTDSSGVETSPGGPGAIGLTREEMTTPFAGGAYTGWDFVDVWLEEHDVNDGYPIHRWQTDRYTLQYTSGPNGSLEGDLQQVRIPGINATTVTAVPDEGYSFQSWSDGSTENPRTDLKVMSDLDVTANFIESDEVQSMWVIR